MPLDRNEFSEKMTATSTSHSFLIFGAKGWIAGMLRDLLEAKGVPVNVSYARVEDREHVIRYALFCSRLSFSELELYKPTHVLNCAGVVRFN